MWVRVPRLPLAGDEHSGSWSNRKTSVLQTEDSGAIPDESIFDFIRSCSPAAKAASLQEEERWFESTQDHFDDMPRYANRGATRLKIECLRVQIPPWASIETRLGRQSADHLGLEPGMLWVRVPPELIFTRDEDGLMKRWSIARCLVIHRSSRERLPIA